MGGFKAHSRAGVLWFGLALIPIGAWYYYRFGTDLNSILHQMWQLPVCFICCYLGALFPDVDITSTSQKVIYSIVLVLDITLIVLHYYEIAAWIGVGILVISLLKHRGFTHRLSTAFLIPLPLLVVPILLTENIHEIGVPYYAAAVVGYLSHLWVDR
ncbi:MAG: hypothetical protein D6675_06915 [Gemmatimonadetes bacterium]|nr:MAG: hypothetical protein D6675_06915 [Gemmatimonadota bacterium]